MKAEIYAKFDDAVWNKLTNEERVSSIRDFGYFRTEIIKNIKYKDLDIKTRLDNIVHNFKVVNKNEDESIYDFIVGDIEEDTYFDICKEYNHEQSLLFCMNKPYGYEDYSILSYIFLLERNRFKYIKSDKYKHNVDYHPLVKSLVDDLEQVYKDKNNPDYSKLSFDISEYPKQALKVTKVLYDTLKDLYNEEFSENKDILAVFRKGKESEGK